MLILGIEASCDETAISLLEVYPVKSRKTGTPEELFDWVKIKVLSNVVSSQVKLHAKYGGVVPYLAAREHVKNLPKVLKLALGKLPLRTVNLLTVTHGPGLISSLLVGTAFAKTLAWKYGKPIIGVNHLEGHIISNWLKSVGDNYQLSDISYQLPAVCLIVSGGHTELVLMTGIGKYKVIGQTLDDAAGEAFDKIARILGLGYPGGPAISREAKKLKAANYELGIKLPRPMLNSKNLDFSFSGLKTAVLYLVRDLTKTHPLSEIKTAIAAEAQQAIVDVLVAKTILAAQKYKAKSIMLSGGVSANKLLRQELERQTTELGVKFFKPAMEYTTDNAAMIALAGYLKYSGLKNKKTASWQSLRVDANLTI